MTIRAAQPDTAAYSINDFCGSHGISRSYLYVLWRRGEGPRFMQVGERRLISREAAADWRASLERTPRALVAA